MQNSLICIRDALLNTSTLNFKIHKNLHSNLDGGVIFYTLANSDESNADEVFISAL